MNFVTARQRALKTRLLAAAALGLMGVAAPVAAFAQATDDTMVPELVVTAQKRSENIRDVPVSISVLTGDQLAKQHVANYADLARSTPGLSFSNTGSSGLSRISLRGISSAQGSATVGIYLNDISLTIPNQFFTGVTLPRLFDLDHVEVLRGPQGTLYGDSSLGGTLRFITKGPLLGVFAGEASAEGSKTDAGGANYKLEGVVNAPVGDNAAFRLAVQREYLSGFIDHVNSQGVVDNKNVDAERTTAVRASFLWNPSDDLKVTSTLQWQQTASDDTGITKLSLGKFQENRPVREPSEDTLFAPSVTVEKRFGDLTFTAISGYAYRRFDRQFDGTIYDSDYVASVIDDSYGPTYETIAALPGIMRNTDAVATYSQEFRLASPSLAESGKRYEWQVGAYFAKQKITSLDHEYVVGLDATVARLLGTTTQDAIGYATPGGLIGYFNSVRRNNQVALFAEGSFKVTDKLKATVGLRQVRATSQYALDEGGWLADGAPARDDASTRSTPLTPKFALTYEASDSVSLYANAAKGFRLGGQNNALTSFCAADVKSLGLADAKSYQSDSLWSYEGGAKTRLFGGRVTFNASAFYIDWKNVQQSVRLAKCGSVITGNAGDARSQGGELELRAMLTDHLTLNLSGAITDAKITKASAGTGAVDGSHLLGVPENTASIGLDYNRPLTNRVDGFFSVNWSHTGESSGAYATTSQDYRRPSYDLVDASLGVDIDKVEVSLFAKNLLNEDKVIQKPSVLFITQGLVLRPRTIGLNVRAKF
jgi:outer membrane receptor protein involved in Fe transport